MNTEIKAQSLDYLYIENLRSCSYANMAISEKASIGKFQH